MPSASEPSATSTSASTASASADGPYRLPRTIEPLGYRLVLTPDVEAATFTGTAEIDVRLHDQTDEIVLNAVDLVITEASVSTPAKEPVSPSVSLDPETERVTLRVAAPLAKGDATVRLSYTGTLGERLRGFYRSRFVDEHGRTRWLAATQMESTDARRVFPCWDEPDRKATFEVTLVVDEGTAAYSNSPIVEEGPVETEGGTKRVVRFSPTMKMSTYLVAFVVGPMVATDPVDVDGVPVRIVHAPGKSHLTAFAIDVARHALEFFTRYFGIPYPGEKLDLVAIPDFAFGAMENLGCVTFREAALLVDPAAASRLELERIADVIHHEIAHMWFGDLVTMEWWEGIWLNEAFANFMQVLATDDFRPAWDRWTSFGLERETALAVDGLHTTRPIEYPVASPEEADGMFDALTYEKGGSVLRMLEQYLGADVFRDGVRRYLEAHAYANTVTSDLWNALEEVSGEPVRAMADSWILQGGHPLVSVEEGSLAQRPFSYLPEPLGGESAIGRRWLVPLLVRAVHEGGGGDVHRLLLTDEPVEVPAVRPELGVGLVNAGGWGVYRVGYTTEHLADLAQRLRALSPLERFDLVADTWALVLAGRRRLGELLGLAASLDDEDEPAVYETLAASLRLCYRVAERAERHGVSAATRSLLGPRAASLGWDARPGEGERIPTLRGVLIAELGTTGEDPEIRAEAARLFDAAHDGGPAIDPDLGAAVLRVVADQDREGDFEKVLERYRHPANPQDERRHLMVLGAFPDVGLCHRAFDLAMSEVRVQDGTYLIRVLLANRIGGPAIWERVKSDWTSVLERFPDVTHAPMLEAVRLLCTDPALAADVDRFLRAHPLPVGGRSVAQTLEQLAVNVRFTRRMGQDGDLAAALATITT